MSQPLILYRHNKPIPSIFNLWAPNEVNHTRCLGWALANAPVFLRRFLSVVGIPGSLDIARLALEESKENSNGRRDRTDIEIRGADIHVIVEAKQGWMLPNEAQLRGYAERFDGSAGHEALVTLSACSKGFASVVLRQDIAARDGHSVRVAHLSWRDVFNLAAQRHDVVPRERFVLTQLCAYMRKVMDVRDQESNIVWVQPLTFKGTQEALNDHGLYWFPAKYQEAPNYLGFYWDGRLQQLRHVEEFEIVAPDQVSLLLKPAGRKEVFRDPHYVFKLGANFGPVHGPRTGKIWAAGGPPKKCMLHTLFTCDSIGDAVAETKRLLSDTNVTGRAA